MPSFVSAFFLILPTLVFANDNEFQMTYPYLNTFEYSGPGQIEIHQGKENKFFFKALKEIQNLFSVSYSSGTLKIEPKDLTDVSQIPEVPHIILIVNRLQKLIFEGDNYVDIDFLKTDNLMVDVKKNGSTVLEGNIHSERFAISIVGNSQAIIRGAARYQSIYMKGPGLYDGKGFLTDDTNVRLLGASSCLIDVRDNLSISIQGCGHVHYLGKPKVSKTIKGEGVVSPLTKASFSNLRKRNHAKSRSACPS